MANERYPYIRFFNDWFPLYRELARNTPRYNTVEIQEARILHRHVTRTVAVPDKS